MIDFSSYVYAYILSQMLSRVPREYDLRQMSIIQTALGPAAYALEDFYMILSQVQDSAFVQSAVGGDLDNLAVIGGISRYPASAAVRLGVFNIPIPIGARFSTVDGSNSINFIATAKVTDTTYQLTAETLGNVGNSYVGPILPITYIAGLTSAQVTDILVPGDEEETDNELRVRLITALNEKPFGGNMASYRENILAIDGVGAVQIYPVWDGGGTVKCSILGSDLNPASETLIENVQNSIDPPPNQGLGYGLAPIGAKVTITSPAEVTIHVAAQLTLRDGHDISQVQPLIEASLEDYFHIIRAEWGNLDANEQPNYSASVYISRVIAAIVATEGVANATNVTLNGGTADINLTETGTLQQVPKLGTVNLSE